MKKEMSANFAFTFSNLSFSKAKFPKLLITAAPSSCCLTVKLKSSSVSCKTLAFDAIILSETKATSPAAKAPRIMSGVREGQALKDIKMPPKSRAGGTTS